MIRIRDLDLLGVRHIIRHMRAQDWIEVSNLVPRAYCDPDLLTMLVMQSARLGFLVEVDGIAAAVVQAVEKHNGCWSVGMFATDDFNRCWRAIFKQISCVLIPAMVEGGARYCEAHVHADNVEAQKFLARLGFRAVSLPLNRYGAFGETFILYAVTYEELPHVLRQSAESPSSPSPG